MSTASKLITTRTTHIVSRFLRPEPLNLAVLFLKHFGCFTRVIACSLARVFVRLQVGLCTFVLRARRDVLELFLVKDTQCLRVGLI